jgi:hypothetical protein
MILTTLSEVQPGDVIEVDHPLSALMPLYATVEAVNHEGRHVELFYDGEWSRQMVETKSIRLVQSANFTEISCAALV